jgi:diguanylate cyclase (GGDEF)-like protein
MSLAAFRRPTPSFLDTFDAFAENAEACRRFLLTFNDGSHLVGVPAVRTSQDRANPDAMFDVTTAVASYKIPFKLLAYAQPLVESGLRPSDGQTPVPEPCSGPPQRTKHEKFAILDSPRLLREDLERGGGVFGSSVLYLDVDYFKALNTKHSERVIDKTVLPEFQAMVAAAVHRHGFAYAEGGDEVVIVLPNTSTSLAAAFAEELRHRIEGHPFVIDGANAHITVSIGVASSTSNPTQLTEWANLAKAEAKQRGRNRTVTTHDGEAFHEVATMRRSPA